VQLVGDCFPTIQQGQQQQRQQVTMTIFSPTSNAQSTLFTPLTINNGNIQLAHRVIMAPLTRNRGTPLKAESTPEDPNRIWLPNNLMAEYYAQRASKGGLIVTEGVPPSLEVRGLPAPSSLGRNRLLAKGVKEKRRNQD
jgi:2,4-dienoyl-CoA reductase-like NADH-dependent reductase (Old Yellow Enzyme family)